MKAEPQMTDWKVSRPILSIGEMRDYGFRIGHVITPYGVVGFYDQIAGRRDLPLTRFDFVVNGRCYAVTWRRTFTDRYLKTLAMRFARNTLLAGDQP